jgi:S-adenosylmethionine decarboxylase proenzyme
LKALGKHILAEFYDCDQKVLNNVEKVEFYMKRAALECGATIVNSIFHTFNPHGVSGVVVIAESHLTIHTWPEYNYAAVDVFSCGNSVDPRIAITVLKKYLSAKDVKIVEINRGEIKGEGILPYKPSIVNRELL